MFRSYYPKQRSFLTGGFRSRRSGPSNNSFTPKIVGETPIKIQPEEKIQDNFTPSVIRKNASNLVGNFAGKVIENVTPKMLDIVISKILEALTGSKTSSSSSSKKSSPPPLPPKTKERIIKGGSLDIVTIAKQLGFNPSRQNIIKCLLGHKGDIDRTKKWIYETMN